MRLIIIQLGNTYFITLSSIISFCFLQGVKKRGDNSIESLCSLLFFNKAVKYDGDPLHPPAFYFDFFFSFFSFSFLFTRISQYVLNV